ncbi:hypothetical protein CC86DRAFT_409957 [Ophiobolus disseminans]|uniref:Uncharacterized protein n=1 Tax=Ophiobolus disseminans TaxID=1469910 RepID=A0A6A6ZNH9_9PLEO|nr:hypothetical protein CC86DRAFT_409957 [Ophiobolus disseminans]
MSTTSSHNEYKYALGSTLEDEESLAAGVPASKSFLSWRDVATIAVVLSAAAGAIIAVYLPATAVSLGQTNQLVIVGFCLTIMAMGTTRQITLASIMYDVQRGRSSLQDFEALLRKDLLAMHASVRTKLVVFLLGAIPLALSVSYKRFVGGYSSVEVVAQGAEFGFAMPPGFGRVGVGLAYGVNQYLPYWLDADVNRTYGFALYVQSNTTAALLDAPFASYFEKLQNGLRNEDSILVSATVNATVTERTLLSNSDLTKKGWDKLRASFDKWHTHNVSDVHGILWASHTKDNNNSRTIVSAWDMRNETEESRARQLYTNRQEANGTWEITSSSITLHSAKLLPQTEQTRSRERQKIIAENRLGIDNTLLLEFNYFRYPRPRAVDTTPALVVVAQSALIASYNRHQYDDEYTPWENGTFSTFRVWDDLNHYRKLGHEIRVVRQRVTLRRHPAFLVILLLNPLLTLLGVAAKLWLYHSPVDENVGLVSLLAAVEPETLGVLSGAALSGKLNRRIETRFVVEDGRIVVHLDKVDGSGSLLFTVDDFEFAAWGLSFGAIDEALCVFALSDPNSPLDLGRNALTLLRRNSSLYESDTIAQSSWAPSEGKSNTHRDDDPKACASSVPTVYYGPHTQILNDLQRYVRRQMVVYLGWVFETRSEGDFEPGVGQATSSSETVNASDVNPNLFYDLFVRTVYFSLGYPTIE